MSVSAALPDAIPTFWRVGRHLGDVLSWLGRVASGGRGRLRQAALWTLVTLIVLRLAAPWILTAVANHELSQPGNYRGSVRWISLSLLSGTYAIDDLRMESLNPRSGAWDPMLEVDRISVATEWRTLFHGVIAGDIVVMKPVFHVINPSKNASAKPTLTKVNALPAASGEQWQDRVRKLIRLDIDRLVVIEGTVTYVDEQHTMATAFTHIGGVIDGLVVLPSAKEKRASYHVTADTPGNGLLSVEGTVDPLAATPTFTAKGQLDHLDLPKVNNLSGQFDHLTFKSGVFSGYTELVSDGHRVDGYAKVLFHDLDIETFRDNRKGALLRAFWRTIVPVGEALLDNDDLHQHAARIVISGRVDDPNTDGWAIIGSALENAFVKPLLPGFSSAGAD